MTSRKKSDAADEAGRKTTVVDASHGGKAAVNGGRNIEADSYIEEQLNVIWQGKSAFFEDAAGRDLTKVYSNVNYNFYGLQADSMVSTIGMTSDVSQRVGDITLNPLIRAEIRRVNAVYSPMANHNQALQRLRERRLVFLCGKQGSGKRTAAIRLLIEFFGCNENIGHNAIYELNPALKLSNINVKDIPDRAGLFIESDGHALQDLNQFQLRALLSRLQDPNKANALIVVSPQCPTQLPLEHHDLIQPWCLQWPEPIWESQAQVLLRHFKFVSHDAHVDIDRELVADFETLLQDAKVQNLLRAPWEPRRLVRLVGFLRKSILGQISLQEALDQFHEKEDEVVAAWFAQGHAPELESLLIATAVFNGLPYSFISEASQELLHLLMPEATEQHDLRKGRLSHMTLSASTSASSLFATRLPVDERLKRIHAHQEVAYRHSHFGEVREKVMQLDNSHWQVAVLRFLWKIEGMQKPFLTWLMPYGAHSTHTIRQRAAAAIGVLALEDFGYIEAEVLRGWAGSPQSNVRRSAAQVVGMTIWDEHHSGPSAGLLHYWATQTENCRWKWTAASAYAGLAGLRYPQQTLNDLKVIAQKAIDVPLLLEPFFFALINLYGEWKNAPEQRLTLLQSLLTWSELPADRAKRQGTLSLRRAALLGFLYLVMPDQHDSVWRLAVQDFGESSVFRDIACQLLHRSLNFRQPARTAPDGLHPRKMALDIINRLIVFVGRERSDIYEHLRTLLQAYRQSIAESPNDLQRIHYKAIHWEDAKIVAPELVSILI